MPYILTLAAAIALESADITKAIKLLGIQTGDKTWLSADKAIDITLPHKLERATITTLREALNDRKVDVFITSSKNRRKKLLLADMDSTIVTGETLDDLADFAGIKDQIAAITARAMNGELDFHDAIRERVALLKDLSALALDKTINGLHLNPGAESFINTMKKHGATCVLVSGGFTLFTEAVAQKLPFDHHHGNVLGVHDGKLTGTVADPILDKHAKVTFLRQYMSALNLTSEECLTIGDGANDLPMLKMAGLGMGYNPKPAVAAELENMIIHGDLATTLYAQGYTDQEII